MNADKIGIHTSDRMLYKRCRRKWDLASPTRQALAPVGEAISHFWFGSGFHFALEDYHGLNIYGDPLAAFKVYYDSHKQEERPSEAREMIDLAEGMFEHYKQWIKRRDLFRTVWVDASEGYEGITREGKVPLVEYSFAQPINDRVEYRGTFDRIVQDEWGRYWILDYKTAARFDTSKLEMDPQVSAYCYYAQKEFGVPFEGMVFMQFLKSYPKPPRVLKNGEFSVAQNQSTTHDLFLKALNEAGKPVTQNYADYLTSLAKQETVEGDKYIRYDLVRRSQAQLDTVYQQILLEVEEMTNPNLPIYPNPTRDCVWDCSFKSLCVAMDDGSDWEFLRDSAYAPKKEINNWRSKLEAKVQD